MEGRRLQIRRIARNDPAVTDLCWDEDLDDDDDPDEPLIDAELLELARSIPGNTHLLQVSIIGCKAVTEAGMLCLVKAIRGRPRCAIRSLMYVHSGAETAAVCCEAPNAIVPNIVRALKDDAPSFTELDMSWSDLNDKHLSIIARALAGNTHFQDLTLSCNNYLTANGIWHLARALPSCSLSRVCWDDEDVCAGNEEQSYALRSAFQRVLASRILGLVRSNDSAESLRFIRPSGIWLTGFGDAEAAQLAESMSNNTHVRYVWLDARNCQMTESGLVHLERVVGQAGSGIIAVRCPHRWSAPVSVSPTWTRVGRLCFTNLIRRLAANDRSVTKVYLLVEMVQAPLDGSATTGTFEMSQLALFAEAIQHNFCLRMIVIDEQIHIDNTAMSMIVHALPHCGVEEICLVPSAHRCSKAMMDRIDELCNKNCTKRIETEKSIALNRPYQRLLLAALYESSTVLFSYDLLIVVRDKLNDDCVRCPFRHSGAAAIVAETHSTFEWHKRKHERRGLKRKTEQSSSRLCVSSQQMKSNCTATEC